MKNKANNIYGVTVGLVLSILIASFLIFIPFLHFILAMAKSHRMLDLTTEERETMARLGEAYIVWHSFFDSLACLLIAVTLFVQIIDNRRRAIDVEAHRVQGILFPSLNLFDAFIQRISFEKSPAFVLWLERLGANPNNVAKDKFIEDNGHQLGAYCRHLATMCSCILTSELPADDKKEYLDIISAHLSQEEVEILRIFNDHISLKPLQELRRKFGSVPIPLWLQSKI